MEMRAKVSRALSQSARHPELRAIREHASKDKPCLPEYRYSINKRATQRKQGCKPLSGEFDGQFIEQHPSY
jgi:hypothetical protein